MKSEARGGVGREGNTSGHRGAERKIKDRFAGKNTGKSGSESQESGGEPTRSVNQRLDGEHGLPIPNVICETCKVIKTIPNVSETNEMALVGFEVLTDTGGLPEEHLGLLLESR